MSTSAVTSPRHASRLLAVLLAAAGVASILTGYVTTQRLRRPGQPALDRRVATDVTGRPLRVDATSDSAVLAPAAAPRGTPARGVRAQAHVRTGTSRVGTTAAAAGREPLTDQLWRLVGKLDLRRSTGHGRHSPTPSVPLDVCPEVFRGHNHDRTPWRAGNCSRVRNLSEIVTVVIHAANATDLTSLTAVLADLRAIYPGISVLVAGVAQRALAGDGVAVVETPAGGGRAAGWNRLAAAVRTKYTLVATDLTRVTADARLERLVATLAAAPQVGVVGGAFRSASGQWRAGCWQTRLSAYQLQRTEGYEMSAEQCMLCDMLDGPFLARSDVLRRLPFDTALPTAVALDDWFLRVKQLNTLAAVCPDAMFYVGAGGAAPRREHWRRLAAKWQLNVIRASSVELHQFSCGESGTACPRTAVDARYLTPPCCYARLAHALRRLRRFLQRHKARYVLAPRGALTAGGAALLPPWRTRVTLLADPAAVQLVLARAAQLGRLGLTVTPAGGSGVTLLTPHFQLRLRRADGPLPAAADAALLSFCGVPLPVRLQHSQLGRAAGDTWSLDTAETAETPETLETAETAETLETAETVQPCPRPGHHACRDQVLLAQHERLFELYSRYVEI